MNPSDNPPSGHDDPGSPVVAACPALDSVASTHIEIAGSEVVVRLPAADGSAVTLRFSPYQAVRLTTVDCEPFPRRDDRPVDRLHAHRASPWLEQLSAPLALRDPGATFMRQAIHFVLPAADDLLEVVAWRVSVDHAGQTQAWPAP